MRTFVVDPGNTGKTYKDKQGNTGKFAVVYGKYFAQFVASVHPNIVEACIAAVRLAASDKPNVFILRPARLPMGWSTAKTLLHDLGITDAGEENVR